MSETKKIHLRGYNEPIEKSATGYEWNGEVDISLNVPPAILIAIAEDLLQAPEAKEMVRDGLVQFISKKLKIAQSIERNYKEKNAKPASSKTTK